MNRKFTQNSSPFKILPTYAHSGLKNNYSQSSLLGKGKPVISFKQPGKQIKPATHKQHKPNMTLQQIFDNFDSSQQVTLNAQNVLKVHIKSKNTKRMNSYTSEYHALNKPNLLGQNKQNKRSSMINVRNKAKNIHNKMYQQNEQQFQEQNGDQTPNFVFNPKNYRSGKNVFSQAFKQYQRSTSRSNSRNKKDTFRKQNSQIRLGLIDQQSIMSKLRSERHSMQKGSFDSFEHDSSLQNGSRRAVAGSNMRNNPSQDTNENQCLKGRQAFNKFGKQPLPGKVLSPQFSFQNQMAKNHSYQHQQKINSNIYSHQPSQLSHQGYQPEQLHTIQQVQESLRSIQIPSTNTNIDPQLSRRIALHFEQIKQNMLNQLLMRSREGQLIDQESMDHIVEEIQQAADNIVGKYCQKQNNNSKIHSYNISNGSIKQQQSQQISNKSEVKSQSIVVPLKTDICASDQNQLFHNRVSLKTKSQKQLQDILKEGLIEVRTNKQQSSFQNNLRHKTDIQIIDDSFASPKQVALDIDHEKYLKYGEGSKGAHSSISSIDQDSIKHVQKTDSIKSKPISEKSIQPIINNKDSMQNQVQNLNKYTFLKAHKNKVHCYQQKEMSSNQYQIQQNDKDKVYTVKYDVKVLDKSPQKQRKSTQVVRLSPFKFKKKQEVVADMVKYKFISRQSQSIVYEEKCSIQKEN